MLEIALAGPWTGEKCVGLRAGRARIVVSTSEKQESSVDMPC
jgi:hypothetical protein